MLSVTFLTASEVLFDGDAASVILPGEKGVFEIGFFHRPLVSRLLPGLAAIDQKKFWIRHGVVKIKSNRVIAMVEIDREHESRAA